MTARLCKMFTGCWLAYRVVGHSIERLDNYLERRPRERATTPPAASAPVMTVAPTYRYLCQSSRATCLPRRSNRHELGPRSRPGRGR